MAVLYRKYRPQLFEDVVGQQAIVKTLKNQVKGGSVAHAYLFTGSRGVGKTSVARILAKALNCPNQKNGEPCGTCAACEQIVNGNFLDLVEIDAASNTGVDNIRELIEHVKFSPSVGKYKVFIIDEVHMLSKGAFNALLKTLEEPPKHAVFILATTEVQKIPATIISRTQRFDFSRLPKEDLKKHLESIVKKEKLGLSNEIVDLIAALSEGGGRDALSLLDKVATLGDGVSLADTQRLLGVLDISLSQNLVGFIAKHQAEELPAFFDSLNAQGTDFLVYNRDLLEYLRKLLVYKISGGKDKPEFDEYIVNTFVDQAASMAISDILFAMRLFLRSYKEIPSSPTADLPVLLSAIEATVKKQDPSASPAPAIKKTVVSPVVQVPIPKVHTEGTISKPASQEPVQEVVSEEPVITAEESSDEVSAIEVNNSWPQVIEIVRKTNGPLATLLRSSPILRTERGKIVVAVKYVFHKQNIETPKAKQIISGAIEQVLGKKLGVLAEVSKEEKKQTTTPTEMIGDALKIFGGELVE